MALLTFALAAVVRLICASKRNETARPAASSSGDVIFEPEDRRASDLASMLCDAARFRAPVCADMFVLITITDSFHESPPGGGFLFHGVLAEGDVFQGFHLLPVGVNWLPTAIVFRQGAIGTCRNYFSLLAPEKFPGSPRL